MTSLNKDIRELIFEVSYVCVEDWTELREGPVLGALLRQIDTAFFEREEPPEDWRDVETLIEKYLAAKGMGDRVLSLELEGIEEGSVESLSSALLQVVAVLAVFQPQKWRVATTYLSEDTAQRLCAIVDNMANEIRMKCGRLSVLTRKESEGQRLKDLLIKLEVTEEELEGARRTIHALRKDAALSVKRLTEKETEIGRQREALEDAGRVKDQLVTQLQQAMSAARPALDDNWKGKAEAFAAELEHANRALFDLRTQVAEKDDELSKKDLLLGILTDKQAEVDDLQDKLNSQQRLLEILKRDNELLEHRLASQSTEHLETEGLMRSQLDTLEAERSQLRTDLTKMKRANQFLVKLSRKPAAKASVAKENPGSSVLEQSQGLEKLKVSHLVSATPVRHPLDSPLRPKQANSAHDPSHLKQSEWVDQSKVIEERPSEEQVIRSKAGPIEPSELFNSTLNWSACPPADWGRPSESPFSPSLRPEHASILYSLLGETMAREAATGVALTGRDAFRRRDILKHFELTKALEFSLS